MRRLLIVILVVLALSLAPTGRANGPQATFSGYVRDIITGAPLAGATVVVGTVTIVTGGDGVISTTPIPLAGPSEQVDVTVSKPGYFPWSFQGLTLEAGQPIELRSELRPVDAPPPIVPAEPRPDTPPESPGAPDSALLPPAYIRIGRTYSANCVIPGLSEDIPVDTIPFADYVRSVLPNEWVAGWPAASLDAGAIAVKQFAWYSAFVERKWQRRGYNNFDLLDNTCDQVYRPGTTKQATDAAVARTWHTYLSRNGRLFPTFFRDRDATCESSITPDDCMGQWGSYDLANAGWTAEQILQYYYAPADYNVLDLTPRVYVPLVTR